MAASPLLWCEHLEPRDVPATAAASAGTLAVSGTPGDDRIRIYQDATDLVVLDGTTEIARIASSSITGITIDTGDGDDTAVVDPAVTQPATLTGGSGRTKLVAGGGSAALGGGAGDDALFGGAGPTSFDGGAGADYLFKVLPSDPVAADAADTALVETMPAAVAVEVLAADEVEKLLARAAAAAASSDAIIVITDRNGRILGVRVEGGVDSAITSAPEALAFAIDGALAKARTGAFFGNNDAPLTSRTVQFISQSTITEREVNSNPNDTDPNSTVRGPGFVAAVGVGGHFPPGVANTPQVDLFQIEHTNRDGTFAPGPDRIKGTGDDVRLDHRFNLPDGFVPDPQKLAQIDSYGFETGTFPTGGQSRGIATLPGGIPIFKNGQVVGGIGVFFPGKTGYATEENAATSTTYDPTRPDRTLEAEWIAFAAVGGATVSVGGAATAPVGDLAGVPPLPGFGLPNGRIDLVGITLDVFGPGGAAGLDTLLDLGRAVGRGDPNDGANKPINAAGDTKRDGEPVPSGWLVTPHDGVGITKAEVERIVLAGMEQANLTRAAIRLPQGTRAKFVFAVADRAGEIVGLFRMPDATVFSIDVAIAKARNVAYYADPSQLQPIDQIDGVPAGTAFTNRTFRYVGEPRFPEGIDGAAPGPFSQLNDGGADVFTGRQIGPPLPASAFQSVIGYDAFNPGTNFRQVGNQKNQNGIVFFPGSAPIYRATGDLIGGFGVSGDGVDQDDVATVAGQTGFDVPPYVLRADDVFVRGVRLPYQKFNRNPEG